MLDSNGHNDFKTKGECDMRNVMDVKNNQLQEEKHDIAWMGRNLGFIEKVVLVDGTVIDNVQVLYNAPIPSQTHLNKIFEAANEASIEMLGQATKEWSEYPELS